MNSKLKLVVLTIFLIMTTSFARQDEIIKINEQDLIDSLNTNNIEEYDSRVILGDIPISSEKYKKQVRDIRDFMMDNHVFYEAQNMDEITNSYNKLLNDSDNKTVKDLNLDLMKVFSKYRQGHVSLNTVYNGEPSAFIGEINDKYYIVATTDKYKNLLGAEVISINNIKMEDVIDKLEAYAIGENESFRNLTKESILNYYEILKKENVLTEEQNIYELKKGDTVIKLDLPFEKSKEFIVSKLKINGRKTERIKVKQKNDNKEKYNIIKPLKLSVDKNKLHYIETKDDNLILRYNSCTENENYK
ncbi:MAG: peptidase S41, partial [Finegoldia magna]|nr:peptidase S41 [Finegoldia magna]